MNEEDYEKAEKNLDKCNCNDEGLHVDKTYHFHVCKYKVWFEKTFKSEE